MIKTEFKSLTIGQELKARSPEALAYLN